MVVVDTNVLVYAADRHSAEHAACRSLVDRVRQGLLPWYVTWSIVYEFLRVTTHPRVFRRPWTSVQAWGFVTELLRASAIGVLTESDRHPVVAADAIGEFPWMRGNLVHDFHTAMLMREHGIRQIYTCDSDFHRFEFLQVLDPLAG